MNSQSHSKVRLRVLWHKCSHSKQLFTYINALGDLLLICPHHRPQNQTEAGDSSVFLSIMCESLLIPFARADKGHRQFGLKAACATQGPFHNVDKEFPQGFLVVLS